MSRLIYFILILSLILVAGCSKERFEGPDSWSDGFEGASEAEDLIQPDEAAWSFFQLTSEGNQLSIDTIHPHSGSRCLKAVADRSSADLVSKCSFSKQFMAFWEGETVKMSAWIYLEGAARTDWIFIFDLEEKAAIGAGPGMRLAITGDSSFLVVEHKYPNPNITQEPGNEISFPHDQWVHVEMETLLSQKKNGYVKVWQDGQLILEKYNWKTLPSDILYGQQGTKGMYNSIEFGVTANTRDRNVTLYVDDVEVGLLP